MLALKLLVHASHGQEALCLETPNGADGPAALLAGGLVNDGPVGAAPDRPSGGRSTVRAGVALTSGLSFCTQQQI